jgi:hypothetical protein
MKTSRREFIGKTALATLSASILSQVPSGMLYAYKNGTIREREDIALYYKLLKDWCDAMIKLQFKDKGSPDTYGGIHCPACGLIHGRSADAAFSFLYMADHTKDEKYLNAALQVYNWAERNVSMPDGSWINEKDNPWKGTTVFGAIALGESLKHHSHLLDAKTRESWMERLRKACDFLYGFMTKETSNINYPLCSSYAFALGGKLLNEPKFIDKGREMAYVLYDYLTPENKFIYGELRPRTQCPRGYWPVDLSYNVEETLPMLVMYGLEMQDEEFLKTVAGSWKTHLEFMLPDGGWDDTFGTRNHKWTYWGSRNSDGCQAGLALLADRYPMFAEAAYRNGQLLEKCTHNGILYGGPHYVSHGVPPCIHHTFAHSKSLAAILNDKNIREQPFVRTELPREKIAGLKTFNDIGTHLISAGKWRATITGNDCEYKVSPHASGGSLSLLYHTDMGLLLTDSLFPELRLREAGNMQENNDALQLLLTPRLEMLIDNVVYRSSRDLGAIIKTKELNDEIRVSVQCKLVSNELNDTPGGAASLQINYLFKDSGIEINVRANHVPEHDALAFFLPVVSSNDEQVNLISSNNMTVNKKGGDLKIATSGKLNILKSDDKNQDRVFSHAPGVEAIPLKIEWDVKNLSKLNIKIST